MKVRSKIILSSFLTILSCYGAFAQSANIRLNQIGFYPNGQKVAIISSENADSYAVLDQAGRQVFKEKLIRSAYKTFGGIYTRIANFSGLHRTGKFRIKLSNGAVSQPFMISGNVNRSLAAAVIKGFYFQRASAALPQKYAGQWHRAAGHPDDKVIVHPSAASSNRPAGTIISSPRGWYDAGDYNKYIVNSGISMGTLLSLYEDYPAYIKTLKVNIPESGNGIPDLLNEVLWNLRWMLTMQDPADGGVYHKLTNSDFDAMIMPDKALKTRYVVQKTTAATLDFAAVMAQSARIFKNYRSVLPGLADSCLVAAQQAWQWSLKNPAVLYWQDELNKKYKPAINTGTYGDDDVHDEWIWAACELNITTHDDQYLNHTNILTDATMPIPSWAQVKLLGYYSLLRKQNELSPAGKAMAKKLHPLLLRLADSLAIGSQNNAYKTVMDISPKNFIWGSNSVAANQGIALLQAYRLTKKAAYLNAALSNLDYLLGRNATGYSYITGYGNKTPMHPHHRLSVADGIILPVPGLMVGGPNPGMQDHVKLASIFPDEAYTDDDRAYAVNEIAINWNAPLVYLVNAIEAAENKPAVKK